MSLSFQLPLFYHQELSAGSEHVLLNEEESVHLLRVLRLKVNDRVNLTNGKGLLAECRVSGSSKRVELEVAGIRVDDKKVYRLSLAVGLLKKRDKLEWIAEKAVEIGVTDLGFFNSRFSERSELNLDRVEKVLVAAVKQSYNLHKPLLHSTRSFKQTILETGEGFVNKFIAHESVVPSNHLSHYLKNKGNTIILVGPEGGFAEEEVELAVQNGYIPVSLGLHRLRTETACLYGITVLKSFLEH